MKLATLKDGTRDGPFIVVSKDLRTAAIADQIVSTLKPRSTTGPSTRRSSWICTTR